MTSARSTTWWRSASSRCSTRTPCGSARGSRPRSPSTCSARAGACCSRPVGSAVYGEEPERAGRARTTRGATRRCPALEQGEEVETRSIESIRKETQPPRRFREASLLAAMETAGKDIEDAELREAMKEAGIGTPATRASIIERLLAVGYIERDGRALHATEKGIQVIGLLGEHPLTSPELTAAGSTGRADRARRGGPPRVHGRHRALHDRDGRRSSTSSRASRSSAPSSGPCPVCGREMIENRKGYSCWTKEDPGCGFVIWKQKAGKSLSGRRSRRS